MTQPAKLTVSDEIAIDIQSMNKWYGAFHVLRDINLRVNRGVRPVGIGEIDINPLYKRFRGTSAG